jgi:hypothetical protein
LRPKRHTIEDCTPVVTRNARPQTRDSLDKITMCASYKHISVL